MSAEQVKQGFKRTEAGVIPEDWKVVPIASLIERNSRITYGVVQPGKDDPRGVLFVRGGDVYDGTIDLKNLRRITLAVSKQYARTQLRGGELLISLVGFPGECAIAPPDLKGANLARQVALVRFSKNRDFDPEYICHLLRSNAGKRLLLKDAFGSAQQVINLKDVNKLEVPLPSRCGEQKAIATALSDVDTLLAQVDQLIAKKRDLKQAAMQQLLTGQTRLPGFSGEWEVKRLGDIAEVAKGEQLHSDESSAEKEIPHYNGGVSPSGFTHKENAPANSIAISEGGNSCGFVQFIDQPFWCGGHCYLVTPKNIDQRFLYQALKGRQKSIMELRVGSGLPNVQKTALLAFSFELPMQREEQTAIATVLSDMDVELATLEARRDKTRSLKQGMMQELLTGRIRLV